MRLSTQNKIKCNKMLKIIEDSTLSLFMPYLTVLYTVAAVFGASTVTVGK